LLLAFADGVARGVTERAGAWLLFLADPSASGGSDWEGGLLLAFADGVARGVSERADGLTDVVARGVSERAGGLLLALADPNASGGSDWEGGLLLVFADGVALGVSDAAPAAGVDDDARVRAGGGDSSSSSSSHPMSRSSTDALPVSVGVDESEAIAILVSDGWRRPRYQFSGRDGALLSSNVAPALRNLAGARLNSRRMVRFPLSVFQARRSATPVRAAG
jgi:hypothetical protein